VSSISFRVSYDTLCPSSSPSTPTAALMMLAQVAHFASPRSNRIN
jgi:hypothetical protein